jgi:hypothetical protein
MAKTIIFYLIGYIQILFYSFRYVVTGVYGRRVFPYKIKYLATTRPASHHFSRQVRGTMLESLLWISVDW